MTERSATDAQAGLDVSIRGKKVVTFGEAMLRLTPPGNDRLERAISLGVTVGGAELNTAIGLVCLGVAASWVSVLPDNALGRAIARGARGGGVDVSGIRWVPESEGRAGIYFLEEGTDPRPSSVTYDRANSAVARSQGGHFDWPALFAGASAFHISGITPAVGSGAREDSLAAMTAAKEVGVTVAFDLNYRSKLWSEEDARSCFQELVPHADILFASRGNLRTFFGFDGEAEGIMRQAQEHLGVKVVVLTRKKGKASRSISLSSIALGAGGQIGESPWRKVEIVDRLGGGDAYAAGFLAAYLDDPTDITHAASLGTAAAAIKHTMPGDFLATTRAEVEAVLASDAGGVLQR